MYSVTHIPDYVEDPVGTTVLETASWDAVNALILSKGEHDLPYLHVTEWEVPDGYECCPDAWEIASQMSGDEWMEGQG